MSDVIRRGQLRREAYRVYKLALSHGELVRPDTCPACGGGGEIHGHHTDYTRPTDVEWLCQDCHRDAHRAMDALRPKPPPQPKEPPPPAPPPMSREEYRTLRESVGSQSEVAARLGVHRQTVSKRERGELPVDREAEIALRCLAEHGEA